MQVIDWAQIPGTLRHIREREFVNMSIAHIIRFLR
jgi:hypothetical protein